MIRVDFLVSGEGLLKGFRISEHADYLENGSDIVCAAVSSAAYMAANTVTEIIHADAAVNVSDNQEDNFMYLNVSKKDLAQCQTVLQGLKLHLVSLEEQYPENLNVFYLEV